MIASGRDRAVSTAIQPKNRSCTASRGRALGVVAMLTQWVNPGNVHYP